MPSRSRPRPARSSSVASRLAPTPSRAPPASSASSCCARYRARIATSSSPTGPTTSRSPPGATGTAGRPTRAPRVRPPAGRLRRRPAGVRRRPRRPAGVGPRVARAHADPSRQSLGYAVPLPGSGRSRAARTRVRAALRHGGVCRAGAGWLLLWGVRSFVASRGGYQDNVIVTAVRERRALGATTPS